MSTPAPFATAPMTTVFQARETFARLQQQAQSAGLSLRPPPPEPTTCCGRGCGGCVWECFYEAAGYWVEDAVEALTGEA